MCNVSHLLALLVDADDINRPREDECIDAGVDVRTVEEIKAEMRAEGFSEEHIRAFDTAVFIDWPRRADSTRE
jgi:hypothetical protein